MLLAAATGSAHAQYVPMDFTSQTFSAMNISAGAMLNQSLIASASPERERSAAQPGKVSTLTRGRSTAAHDLALGYPAAQRAAAERSFAQLLDAFRAIEAQVGEAHGDAAVALACVVIGAYEAYHDETLAASTYPPVIAQLRAAMAVDPAFGALDAGGRRALYERLAIVGMYLLGTRQALANAPTAGDASRLREAAAKYLAELKLDPDGIEIGEVGIALR